MMTDRQIRAVVRELTIRAQEWDDAPEHTDYGAGRALSYRMAAAVVRSYLAEGSE